METKRKCCLKVASNFHLGKLLICFPSWGTLILGCVRRRARGTHVPGRGHTVLDSALTCRTQWPPTSVSLLVFPCGWLTHVCVWGTGVGAEDQDRQNCGDMRKTQGCRAPAREADGSVLADGRPGAAEPPQVLCWHGCPPQHCQYHLWHLGKGRPLLSGRGSNLS